MARQVRSEARSMRMALFCLALVLAPAVVRAFSTSDYQEAMSKTILFWEAQRSGPLPPGSDHVSWRGSSGLNDGSLAGVDLAGGYYDAGDNVKFGFPMAFSMTMLSWSVVEYGDTMSSSGELQHALDSIRWGTDYFLKAFKGPTTLYAQVGDGNTDHACWERPETMDTPRTVYKITADKPGSDLAGETAAALAAASIAFRSSDPAYAGTLLDNAKQLFQFADQHRGKYSDSIPEVQNFYNSFSGYNDELLWAAAWLHRASGDGTYLNYIDTNAQALNGLGSIGELSWDNKLAGAQILIARQVLHCDASSDRFKQMRNMAEQFVCTYVNGGVTTTPDGLAWVRQWAPLQYSNNAAFAAAVYSDYLAEAGQSLTCGGKTFSPDQVMSWAQSQVDYVLGKNNAGQSYMVGFGNKYPVRMHHRGASIPVTETPYSCGEGYGLFYNTQNPDANQITGAIAGGPAQDGSYADDRGRYEQSEPIMYINSGFLGAVARIVRGTAGVNAQCTAAGGGNPPTSTPPPSTSAPSTQSPNTPSPTQSPPSTGSPSTSSPTPSTSSPTPSTSSPTPSTSSPTPSTSSPTSSPTPSTSSPSPTGSNPSPSTSSPTPTGSNPSPSPSSGSPSTSAPTPSTSSPSPTASNPSPTPSSTSPSTQSPTPSTSSPTPSTQSPTPSTSSPTPSTPSPTSNPPPSTSSPTSNPSPSTSTGGSFTISSSSDSTWDAGSGPTTLHTVVITNVSQQTFNNVAVKCNNFHPDQYWNLVKGGADGDCAVPTWMPSFAPGQTLTFGYIQMGAGAQFSINL